MTSAAIALMILSIALMWGGLVISILRLRRHPELGLDADEPGGEARPGATSAS